MLHICQDHTVFVNSNPTCKLSYMETDITEKEANKTETVTEEKYDMT